MRPWLSAPLSLFALLCAAGSDARTWHVAPDGTGDAPTIQAAIDSAAAGDTILVARGTYSENLTLAEPLNLLSRDGPETTIIDGGQRGRVLTIPHGDGDGPLIAGFTLRNGQSPDQGGGVWIGRSGTTLRGNVIENNVAGTFDFGEGGGIYVDLDTRSCLIETNVIQNNLAGSNGGGVVARGTEARQNIVRGNASHVDGGGAVLYSSRFSQNLFVGNYSDHFAAGVVVDVYGEFVNNTVVGNHIANTDRVAVGILVGPFAVVRNNIVVHNTGGTPRASRATGIQCGALARPVTISCNDVWGNDNDEIGCDSVSPANFSANPLFCDETGGNFHISDTSPCAPLLSECGLVGAMPSMCHAVSVQQVPWTRVKRMYR
jgi:parallel beta helix pectate lyase-like protein